MKDREDVGSSGGGLQNSLTQMKTGIGDVPKRNGGGKQHTLLDSTDPDAARI